MVVGGGDGVLGDGNVGGGDPGMRGGDGDLWGADGMLIVGIFAYFSNEGDFVEKLEEEYVLQGNPHVVLCPCFSVDLENDE